ncbi:ATPase, partial [Streptomyces fuscigenes]|nr:ATPase [Streptomyces fuscigenes]
MSLVLGVDSGGSGLRIALGATTGARDVVTVGVVRTSEPVRTGPRGIDADHLLAQVVPAARSLLAGAAARPRTGTEAGSHAPGRADGAGGPG